MTPHPSKAGRAPLTRETIVEKALEILDTDGVDGISMRRLGEALGVEAMALYHHFPNKDAILDGVAARIIEETGPAMPLEEAASDWKADALRTRVGGPRAHRPPKGRMALLGQAVQHGHVAADA